MKIALSTSSCPPQSLVRPFLLKIDFEDAYSFHVPHCPERIEEVYLKIFNTAPLWVEYAMRLRNMLVAPFGLKTEVGQSQREELREGEKRGIFRIYKIIENEVIAGEDDKQLNFRVSVFRSTRNEKTTITVSTMVQYHNSFGKIYMNLIAPFHRMVVKSILQRAIHRIEQEQEVLYLQK